MENIDRIAQELNDNGFAGPFDTGLPKSLVTNVANRVKEITTKRDKHPLYGRYSVRDWHLVEDEFLTLFTAQNIIDILVPVLGENILLWRSKIFLKEPQEGDLGWHQEWGAFNGEEIGNDRPALIPQKSTPNHPWNYTVWVALEDVTLDMGPIRFAKGSNKKRYPIEMQKLTDSEFYVDPFLNVESKEQLIRMVQQNSLVLDIDTSGYLLDLDTEAMDFEQLKHIIVNKLDNEVGAVTLEFSPDNYEIVSMPMKAGQFVVFTERCMHGSSMNASSHQRIGINARYTCSSTQVYPYLNSDNPVDGSNIDITQHKSVLVNGKSLCDANVLAAVEELADS